MRETSMGGLIVIGYQGIGKSTLARKNHDFIDLESSSFLVDGVRDGNWYKIYCKIAMSLACQGRVVFVSSHEVVRRELSDSGMPVVCCVPGLNLKDEWVGKLRDRWLSTSELKDYRAYVNALDGFEENVREISSSGFPVITIANMNYSLEEEIKKFSRRQS